MAGETCGVAQATCPGSSTVLVLISCSNLPRFEKTVLISWLSVISYYHCAVSIGWPTLSNRPTTPGSSEIHKTDNRIGRRWHHKDLAAFCDLIQKSVTVGDDHQQFCIPTFTLSLFCLKLGQVRQNIQFNLTSCARATFALILSEQRDNAGVN